MKTCGTYLIDNQYVDNFSIEPPKTAPEQILEGQPELSCTNLRLLMNGKPAPEIIAAGSVLQVMADVFNRGSSGVAPVTLYVNRKPVESRSFPVIRNNTRTIVFDLRLNIPARQEIFIGETPSRFLTVQGETAHVVCDKIHLSEERLLEGESVRVSALASNLQAGDVLSAIPLYADGKEIQKMEIGLAGQGSKEVHFDLVPGAGIQLLRIGNSAQVSLTVLKSRDLTADSRTLHTYISPKAKPAEVAVDEKKNRYVIKASGWDFYHAEDAYATVYQKQIKGDFVSTVKITTFGERTSEWYRAGLFVRNDISRSFDVEPGSKGSVLMFSTPGRAGIEYDEFGDGCMHKASSENLPENTPTPIWVRLERHGNRFTGSISLDGKTWIIHRQTNPIPGVGEAVDLGLAAGAPDQKQYRVEFADWQIKVEDR